MKRMLVIAVLVVMMGGPAATTGAQGVSGIYPDPPWCPTCFVASHADDPISGSPISGASVLWFWAGSCYDGSTPTQVSATAAVNGSPASVPVEYLVAGARQDVTAHLRSAGCQGGHAVIPVWFPQGFQAGTTAVSVKFYSGEIFAYHVFPVESEIPLSDGAQAPAVGAPKANTITIELTDAQMAALKWWAENPGMRGPLAVDETPRTVAEWVQVFVQPRLDDIVQRYQEQQTKREADVGKQLKRLNAQQCAKLAKDLGVEIASLPCGGGQ